MVLETGTVQWSGTKLLNDLFDIDRELIKTVPQHLIVDEVNNLLIDYMTGKRPIPALLSEGAANAIEAAKDKIFRETFIAENKPTPIHGPHITLLKETIAELEDHWAKTWPDVRVFCLTEKSDNASMWDRYADEYKGAVLEFEAQSVGAICQWALPVEYKPEPPLLKPEVWAELLIMGTTPEVIRAMLDRAICNKRPSWSSETEWRLYTFDKSENGRKFVRFSSNELIGIYLGPKISDDDAEAIVAQRNSRFPRAKIFKGSVGTHSILFSQMD